MSLPIYLTEEALQEEAVGYRFLIEVEKTLDMIAEHPSYIHFLMLLKQLG